MAKMIKRGTERKVLPAAQAAAKYTTAPANSREALVARLQRKYKAHRVALEAAVDLRETILGDRSAERFRAAIAPANPAAQEIAKVIRGYAELLLAFADRAAAGDTQPRIAAMNAHMAAKMLAADVSSILRRNRRLRMK
jgi:hypothetical protein